MDYVDLILSGCQTIYKLVLNTKANKERCERIALRIETLEDLVLTIKQRGPGQISAPVDKALKELCITVNLAKELIVKFAQTKAVKSFLKSGDIEDKFSKMNERLSDNFQVLSGALQIEQGNLLYKVYENVVRQDEEEPLTSPTAPMPHPLPTAPLPLTIPMSNCTVPLPVPTPVYRPAAPTPVHCIVAPRQVLVSPAATPVRPIQVYSPMYPMALPTAPRLLTTAVVSPTTAALAPTQFVRPAASMTFVLPNKSGFIQSFLR